MQCSETQSKAIETLYQGLPQASGEEIATLRRLRRASERDLPAERWRRVLAALPSPSRARLAARQPPRGPAFTL